MRRAAARSKALASFNLRVGVHQDEAADFGGGGDFGDRLQPTVARDRRHAVDVLGKIGFVQQQIDAANLGDVVGVGRGGRVRDVRHAAIRPIEPVTERPARMLERKIGELAAVGNRARAGERLEMERRLDREDELGEQVIADGRQFGCVAVDGRPPEHVGGHQVDEVCQPGDVVEVCVGQENVQSVGAQVLAEVAHPAAGVEHDADLGQHHTRGVTLEGRDNSRRCRAERASWGDRFHGRTYNRPSGSFSHKGAKAANNNAIW